MRLGQLVLTYRTMERRPIREVAKEIGVSHATLSRVERGEEMSGETLSKIFGWMTEKEAK